MTWTFLQLHLWGFPGGSDNRVCLKCGRPKFDPWVRTIPREENRNPLQCSYLENHMDGGAWWATVHRITKSRIRLSNYTFHFQHDERSNEVVQAQCFNLYTKSDFWSVESFPVLRNVSYGTTSKNVICHFGLIIYSHFP